MTFKKNTISIEPFERVEFAFVFFPNVKILGQLMNMAQTVHYLIQEAIPRKHIPDEWGNYSNKPLRIPHLSVGQYGILGCELEELKKIVEEVSQHVCVLSQNMKKELSILDDYIFFDSEEMFNNVSPVIRSTYITLREHYFNRIYTKFPIKQACLAKRRNILNLDELNLIDSYYQNWMMPEKNRMRPHFTVHYHPPYDKESMERILKANRSLNDLINSLSSIELSHLGVVEIDTFGNPVENGLICSYPLKNS